MIYHNQTAETKEKEKSLESSQRKPEHYVRRNDISRDRRLSIRQQRAQKEVAHFQMLTEKNCQTRILWPAEICLRKESQRRSKIKED
jgi:hypothetical protein